MNKRMICDRIVQYLEDETVTTVLDALTNLNKVKAQARKAQAQMAARKMIRFFTQDVYRTQSLFYQRKGALRAAVERAEDFDSYMEPKRRKLEIEQAMVRRIKSQEEWCEKHKTDSFTR
ncbi:hypothetical protein IV203_016231 [Nitzschia inconspicua]|uniref:Uncharacterized protein n=1 Tax=Nitzschia inconspicua TaxID=303405 RepID=A0A9K3K9B3_9STRA|nr:hypothetical protein IV203_017446 [Nitzschia inconspicua]KAG7347526.1 hypothetical protein IV203_016231 [Nitzschia inconspicua]